MPCLGPSMGLQKAQRLQDAKGPFLSPSTQTFIVTQEVEESVSSTLDPKRVGGKMYSGQTWRAAYTFLRYPSLPGAATLG